MSMMIPSSVEAEMASGAENRVICSAASPITRSSERHSSPPFLDGLDRCGRGGRITSTPRGRPFDVRGCSTRTTEEPYRLRHDRSARRRDRRRQVLRIDDII